MMNIEQGISNYELDIKCSSSTRDFMAGAVTRPTACTQYGGLMRQFRHSGRREATLRNPEKGRLLDTGSRPPQADWSGMTIVHCLLESKSKEKSFATDN
jgi:hypothetical protein